MAHHPVQFSPIHNYIPKQFCIILCGIEECVYNHEREQLIQQVYIKQYQGDTRLVYTCKTLLGSEVLLGLALCPMCVHEPHPLGHVIE